MKHGTMQTQFGVFPVLNCSRLRDGRTAEGGSKMNIQYRLEDSVDVVPAEPCTPSSSLLQTFIHQGWSRLFFSPVAAAGYLSINVVNLFLISSEHGIATSTTTDMPL